MFANHVEQTKQNAVATRINEMAAFRQFGANVSIDEFGSALVFIHEVGVLHTGGMESHAINGLTLMGLLDSAMCAASLNRLGPSAKCATVELSVKFLKPVFGPSVCATGRVISRANDILFCEASVADSRGRIRVVSTGVIQKLTNREGKFS